MRYVNELSNVLANVHVIFFSSNSGLGPLPVPVSVTVITNLCGSLPKSYILLLTKSPNIRSEIFTKVGRSKKVKLSLCLIN